MRIARAGDKLLIDVEVDGTAACNDRQRIDLVQACPNEGRGAFAQRVVICSRIIYGGDERVVPAAVDEE